MRVFTIGSSVSDNQGQILCKEFGFSDHRHVNILSDSLVPELEKEIAAKLQEFSDVGSELLLILDFCAWGFQPRGSYASKSGSESGANLNTGARRILDVVETQCDAMPILVSLSCEDCDSPNARIGSTLNEFDVVIIEMKARTLARDAEDSLQLMPEDVRLLNRKIRSNFAVLFLDSSSRNDFQLAKRKTMELLGNASGDSPVRDSFICGDLIQHFCYQSGEDDAERPPRLTIFFNGAIDPAIAKGCPVFQRTSWWSEIYGAKISIPDPTLSKDNTLTTGWAQGSNEHWGIAIQAGVCQGAIEFWRNKIGLSYEEVEVQMFGTSAGGFQALMAGAFVNPRRVIVNNAQFDWLKAGGRAAVKKTLELAYSNRTQGGSIREKWQWRVVVPEFYKRVRFAPPIEYYLNLSSLADRVSQWPELEKFMFNGPGRSYGKGFKLFAYEDPISGHSPLGKEPTIQLLNSSIQDLP